MNKTATYACSSIFDEEFAQAGPAIVHIVEDCIPELL